MREFLLTMLLLAGAFSAQAQTPDLAAAKTTVDRVYSGLPRGDDWTSGRFSPELKRLLQRDAAASQARGDVGAIDAVPFCACQDFAESFDFSTAVVSTGPRKATAVVAVRNGGPPKRVTVQLVRLRSGWAVDDVANPDLPSLKAALRQGLAN